MIVGGLLTAAAFVMAGFIQLQVENSLESVLPLDTSELRFLNGLPCTIDVTAKFNNDSGLNSVSYTMQPLDATRDHVVASGHYDLTFTPEGLCFGVSQESVTLPVVLTHDQQGLMVVGANGKLTATFAQYPRSMQAEQGGALVNVFYAGVSLPSEESYNLELQSEDGHTKYTYNVSTSPQNTPFIEVLPKLYRLQYPVNATYSESLSGDLELEGGAIYTILVHDQTGLQATLYQHRPANQVSILLQVPQYVIITAGEVMFSVTGIQFAYSQAPQSMKSVLQAGWLTTVAVGNLVVVIVAELALFKSRAAELFMFAVLMAVDMLIFAIMAHYYIYVDQNADYVEFEDVKEDKAEPPSDKPASDQAQDSHI